MLKQIAILSLICGSSTVWAQDTWIDQKHEQASQQIDKAANKINNWFGEPNPDKPASATLRVMLDSTWNKHDRFKAKPRIRGNLRLPVLQEKVSVMFGDDSLDNEILDSARNENNPANRYSKKLYSKQNREENSSLALRWSNLNQNLGLDTDADIGVRSGSDVYLRLKAKKNIQHSKDLSTQVEQMYRYGVKSRHFARSSVEVKKQQQNDVFIANYLHVDYVHNKNDKGWSWGNTAYRQHHFSGSRRLNYGIQAGGALSSNGKHKFNSYGVFVGWRQPVWRNWLFAQTELTYANNRDENRKHYPSGFFRLEAIF